MSETALTELDWLRQIDAHRKLRPLLEMRLMQLYTQLAMETDIDQIRRLQGAAQELSLIIQMPEIVRHTNPDSGEEGDADAS